MGRIHIAVMAIERCELAWSSSKKQARERARIVAQALHDAGALHGTMCGGILMAEDETTDESKRR